MIPEKLKINGIKFVLVEKGGKKPFQVGWQDRLISYNCPELLAHITSGGNYGIIGGGEHNLVIVDFDNTKVQEELIKHLPETFTVKTGSGMMHKYFFSNACQSFKIFDEDMNTLVDVQGEGKQAVGPGSTHPNGNKYEVVEDKPIAFIEYSELKALIMPYDRKPKKEKQITLEKPTEYNHDNFLDIVKTRVRIEDVLSNFGVNTSQNPSNCPFHDSRGGKCLGWKDEVAHCFHCEGSWNIFSLVKDYKKYDFKQALLWLTQEFGLQKEHDESRKKYLDYINSGEANEKKKIKNMFLELVNGKDKKIAQATELIVEYILRTNHIYCTKDDLKSEMWIYKDGIYLPQGKSEIKEIMRDILEEWFNAFYYNQVIVKIEADTFIEQQKFFGASYPFEIPVQNGILDILTRRLSPYSPEKVFFNKMPVSYNPDAVCFAIDFFLNDVLANEEDKKVFYELAGFALLKEYRYEKAAMFVGGGRNGKGKSLELLKRLVGIENCSSIPLSALAPDSFNLSELFGKLLNLAGDIGNKDLQDTSMFKSLTGRDLVTTKRKFLSGLNFENYAKFIFACNELPSVYDTSRGFWDRWILLEFPYTFVSQEEYDKTPEKDRKMLKIKDENIINKIVTPEELSGLLNEALNGLDRLIKNHNFSVTLGTKEVKETWIRKANSVVAFAFDSLEEDADAFITKKEFRKRYSEYCKKHGAPGKSDFVIKKALQEMFGASEERMTIGTWPNSSVNWAWVGVKWKN
jgi:P4 family phage/plasmid primase-like protien